MRIILFSILLFCVFAHDPAPRHSPFAHHLSATFRQIFLVIGFLACTVLLIERPDYRGFVTEWTSSRRALHLSMRHENRAHLNIQ